MPRIELEDDKMYADVFAHKGTLTVRLKYRSNDKEVPAGNDQMENLYRFLKECLKHDPEYAQKMALDLFSYRAGTAPIKFNVHDHDDGQDCQAYIAGWVQRAFACNFNVEDIETSTKAAAYAQGITKIDAAKMERAFDAALDMGELMATMSPARLSAFFYNMTLAPNLKIRDEARQFLTENKYTPSDHARNQDTLNRMEQVAKEFIASEQKVGIAR